MMDELNQLGSTKSDNRADRRGQVVLLACFALAVALIPLVLAYLQLGYHADTDRTTVTAPETQAEWLLDRAIHNSTAGIADSYEWSERDSAVQTVYDRLDPPVRALETSRLRDGITYEISYNSTAAAAWERNNCPGGPDRQFGSCETEQGVVMQDRADSVHVLAVAFDIAVTTPDGERTLRTVRPIRTV